MALVTVTFEWDDEWGACYECGVPAAFRIDGLTDYRVCAVCAANSAAGGDTITRIDPTWND